MLAFCCCFLGLQIQLWPNLAHLNCPFNLNHMHFWLRKIQVHHAVDMETSQNNICRQLSGSLKPRGILGRDFIRYDGWRHLNEISFRSYKKQQTNQKSNNTPSETSHRYWQTSLHQEVRSLRNWRRNATTWEVGLPYRRLKLFASIPTGQPIPSALRALTSVPKI